MSIRTLSKNDTDLMTRTIFILLPSPHPTGPIKGAIALANIISKKHPTTIVYLKSGPGVDTPVASSIRTVSLANRKNLIKKILAYRKLVSRGGGCQKKVSISFCFSADLTNLFCLKQATIVSYIRGNLPINYQYEFGKIGFLVAALHLYFMRWFNHVVSMNTTMGHQIEKYCGKQPHIVGNFVDESFLRQFNNQPQQKEGPFRFIYVGRLAALKKVHTILKAAKNLKFERYPFHLDIVGDGQLLTELEHYVKRYQIDDRVTFHGHLKSPYSLMAQADCLVLPSITEGVSRSVLEALYLGVPCLVRNIDGNAELITNGGNGYLFQKDTELSDLMIKTADLSRRLSSQRYHLLPDNCRQEANAQKLLGIING